MVSVSLEQPLLLGRKCISSSWRQQYFLINVREPQLQATGAHSVFLLLPAVRLHLEPGAERTARSQVPVVSRAGMRTAASG